MLDPNVRDYYKSACNDEVFLTEMKKASPDNAKPGFFSSDMNKAIFIGTYLGWRIGKYGTSEIK